MPTAESLPASLPVLPFGGALLLPRGRLPLNIFEPRYLALVEDALGAGRLIGLVQPRNNTETNPPLYTVGCAGRIVSFNETDDGRFLLVLQGVCRFTVGEEVSTVRGYRRVVADWENYLADLTDREEALDSDLRDHLIGAIKPYFKAHGIVANWDTIEQASAERLIASLTAICPFAHNEKQALLETPTITDRAQLLLTLLAMAARQTPEFDLVRH